LTLATQSIEQTHKTHLKNKVNWQEECTQNYIRQPNTQALQPSEEQLELGKNENKKTFKILCSLDQHKGEEI